MQVTTVGLDLAKRVFQVHGIDAVGQVVVRRKLQELKLPTFLPVFRPAWWGSRLAPPRITGLV